jgi:four helix bundle protein
MEYNREKSPLLVKSQAFAVRIINMVDYLSSNRDGRFKSIYDQVLRSGTSIMANVRESQFAQSKADFICKLQIALKEANETMGWLILLTEKMCITEREGTSMKNDCNELIAMLAASVYTSKKNQQLSEK